MHGLGAGQSERCPAGDREALSGTKNRMKWLKYNPSAKSNDLALRGSRPSEGGEGQKAFGPGEFLRRLASDSNLR
jgi:hypothetical protein